MISEEMARTVDYNWRRMFDDSKESILYRDESNQSIFEHLKWNVLKQANILNQSYEGDDLYQLYSGDDHSILEEKKEILDNVMIVLKEMQNTCEGIPDLMSRSMKIAGDKFL